MSDPPRILCYLFDYVRDEAIGASGSPEFPALPREGEFVVYGGKVYKVRHVVHIHFQRPRVYVTDVTDVSPTSWAKLST
jgi:hypothetical protein